MLRLRDASPAAPVLVFALTIGIQWIVDRELPQAFVPKLVLLPLPAVLPDVGSHDDQDGNRKHGDQHGTVSRGTGVNATNGAERRGTDSKAGNEDGQSAGWNQWLVAGDKVEPPQEPTSLKPKGS